MDWNKLLKDALTQISGWVLTTSLGFIVGFLFRWVSERGLRVLPSRALLGLKHPSKVHIVIGIPWGILPETTELHENKGLPIFGYGPLHAYQQFSELLKTAYPKQRSFTFTTSKTFSKQNLDQDLVLIGYPQGNEITKIVMNDLVPPIKFDGHNLIDTATGTIQYKPAISDGYVMEDYGCIIRAPNPYSPASTVFILAGCETFGVKAAAEFFKPKNFHLLHGISRFHGILLIMFGKLVPKARDKMYYQVIVTTHVRKLFTSEPQLVKHLRITVDKKKNQITRVDS